MRKVCQNETRPDHTKITPQITQLTGVWPVVDMCKTVFQNGLGHGHASEAGQNHCIIFFCQSPDQRPQMIQRSEDARQIIRRILTERTGENSLERFISPDRSPRSNSDRNPYVNRSINPRSRDSLHPRRTARIDPWRNRRLLPSANSEINPRRNPKVDFRANRRLSPSSNPRLNPKGVTRRDVLAFYDLSLTPTALAVRASEQAWAMFDANIEHSGTAVVNEIGGAAVFDLEGVWIEHLIPDEQGAWLRFTPRNQWIGITV